MCSQPPRAAAGRLNARRHCPLPRPLSSPPSTLIDLIEENDVTKAKKAVQDYYQNKKYISDVKNRYGHMREQALTCLRVYVQRLEQARDCRSNARPQHRRCGG